MTLSTIMATGVVIVACGVAIRAQLINGRLHKELNEMWNMLQKAGDDLRDARNDAHKEAAEWFRSQTKYVADERDRYRAKLKELGHTDV